MVAGKVLVRYDVTVVTADEPKAGYNGDVIVTFIGACVCVWGGGEGTFAFLAHWCVCTCPSSLLNQLPAAPPCPSLPCLPPAGTDGAKSLPAKLPLPEGKLSFAPGTTEVLSVNSKDVGNLTAVELEVGGGSGVEVQVRV